VMTSSYFLSFSDVASRQLIGGCLPIQRRRESIHSDNTIGIPKVIVKE
jgi:hypothetical protein